MKSRIPVSLLFLGTFILVTLVTGVVGWSDYYAHRRHYDQWDVIYHTLLAFTGDASFITGLDHDDLNPWIDVSRFTGLIATISAVLGLAALVLHGQLTRLRATLRKDHIVMIGASGFALDMYRTKGPITVFDTKENLDDLTMKDAAGKLLKIPDPMNARTGTTRLIGNPATIVFGDADPVQNVERSRVWQSTTKRGLSAILALRIENASISRDLELLSPDFRQAVIFSRSNSIARALVTSMAPTELAIARGQDRVHILLVGLGRINLAVAEEMAMRCHHSKLAPILITILDLDPKGARARIKRERPALLNPDLEGHLDLRFISLDALECCAEDSAAELIAHEKDVPITAVIVAAGEDDRNVAIAISLRQLQCEKLCLRAPIFMRSDSLDTIAAAKFNDLTGGIVPFGGRALDKEDIELDAIYARLAQTIHDRWRNSSDVEENDENAWDNLSNSDKRASFRAALSAIEIFCGAGFVPPIGSRIAGLRLDLRAGNRVLGDAVLIRALCAIEHERWNVERMLDGWRKTDSYRDNEKKYHPLIQPFDMLVARGDRQEKKDERNVKETLTEGIAQHSANPNAPFWRKRWRVGLIGPLSVDPKHTTKTVGIALETLLKRNAELDVCDLEILTPNAPGFDRIAARALADVWKTRTGRPARLLLMNAATPKAMDDLAMMHLLNEDTSVAKKDMVLRDMAAQHDALTTLRESGHDIRTCDCRPLGKSDADMKANTTIYRHAIEATQDVILKIADYMIFDVEPEAKLTLRALRQWHETGKPAPIEI